MLNKKSACLIAALCATSTLTTRPSWAEAPKTTLDTIVVTATREGKPQSELAETIAVTKDQEIEFISPAHPAEELNRTAGVHISNRGGAGHMTAIR
ncbi:MAG: TonB-dependent receptor, partial [Pseudomonadota bacterium]|nr:TonB-dependent receptor [Pseudomonadota bacterium]